MQVGMTVNKLTLEVQLMTEDVEADWESMRESGDERGGTEGMWYEDGRPVKKGE